MKKSAILSTVAIAYFMIGFLVAIAFAIYYHWPFISFLSPGFYSVILTWPFQAIGFSGDLLYYGLTGKQI
ncbi:hypothetical protein A3C26_03675 [Candidatus Daviesbacteria bacterium RIFCSPHIGHO2_02_FULL_39_12]|uniref:Uncharacterized protein n=2 Tax=Candidatus Daviesiibacteriota TaxID=1752718 RepID=A0A1F5JCC6_9BACT|nr:MAG: hypothetical protein A3C26_03675 [Candidatus Daviesbacteria bacterium RIFCSPHIGHO2_02_FULL_39_12]OGE71640.1 MAG: hypothetical protein A3H40_01370 [Candidatus Daviesbacteria bacterium RIFCSPLOWO2_02_FULL_38_15]